MRPTDDELARRADLQTALDLTERYPQLKASPEFERALDLEALQQHLDQLACNLGFPTHTAPEALVLDLVPDDDSDDEDA